MVTSQFVKEYVAAPYCQVPYSKLAYQLIDALEQEMGVVVEGTFQQGIGGSYNSDKCRLLISYDVPEYVLWHEAIHVLQIELNSRKPLGLDGQISYAVEEVRRKDYLNRYISRGKSKDEIRNGISIEVEAFSVQNNEELYPLIIECIKSFSLGPLKDYITVTKEDFYINQYQRRCGLI